MTLSISDQSLELDVVGWDKLWSFKSSISVPLQHIIDVERATEEAKKWFHGWRVPGTNVPGVITAGTYYDGSGRVFWDVHDAEKAIEIKLRDERYQRLVVEVQDPTAAIAEIRQALGARGRQAETPPSP